jgi:hypothetical protein
VAEDGTTIEEWTTNGSVHTIKDKLISGDTYRLVEISAPSGYKFAKDISFTAKENDKVVMSDVAKPKDQKENAKVSVTKQLICDGTILGAEDQVFYVALYEDSACTYRVTEIKAIEFKMASEVTVTFDGLEPGTTYYLGESDQNGSSIVSGQADDGTMFCTDFIQGQAVTAKSGSDAPEIKFLNEFS